MPTRGNRGPELSVIMGTLYNREDLSYLKRSVESILNQTYSDFEFLICDDGASIEAKKYLDLMAMRDKRIKLIRPADRESLPEKLNACLESACGEYIARMDDDDFSHPDRFEKQLKVLKAEDNIDFVGCVVNVFRSGEITGFRGFPEYPTVKNFYITQPYIHPTLIFRKIALSKVNGYCEEAYCDHCEDYDLLLRLYSKGSCGKNIQEALFDYTVWDSKGNRTMKHRLNEVKTRWKRYKELEILPQALPYIIKPLIVGLLPDALLERLKRE